MKTKLQKRKSLISGEPILIKKACALIQMAREQAYRQTNNLIVFTYFHIGKLIVENEQGGETKALYGESTILNLSEKLTSQFGKGFSVDNLENMRVFYDLYKHKFNTKAISETVSRKSFSDKFSLAWSSYVILCKIENNQERSFYELEAIQGNWSIRELQRQINSSLYERLSLSRKKKMVKQLATKGQVIEKPEDALKTPYVLEFLGLESKSIYTESDLEKAIIDKLEHFLVEMGKGFLFQGRQVQFTFDDESFFVDLVLYNRLLRCFVLVDLKIGKLKHQDIGQMQMYVNYYDRFVKTKQEKPSIGIIICKTKSEAVVEFTLPKNNRSIFAKEYKLYLPSKAELKRFI